MEAKDFMAEDSVFVLMGTIFVVYMAIRAWTKGAMALLWALASWGAGGLAGYWMFNHGLALLDRYGDVNLNGFMSTVVSVGLAVVAFSLVRMLAKATFDHIFAKDSFLGNWMYGGGGALLSLLPSAAVLILIALLIRMNGTMWELNEIDKISDRAGQWTERTYPKPIAAVRWRNAVENLPYGHRILDTVDPISGVARRNLAQLVLANYHPYLANGLREHGPTHDIATHPAVVELLANQELNTLVAGGMQYNKYFDILRHKHLRQTLREFPDLRRELRQIDMADEIRVVSVGSRHKKRLPWLKRIFS